VAGGGGRDLSLVLAEKPLAEGFGEGVGIRECAEPAWRLCNDLLRRKLRNLIQEIVPIPLDTGQFFHDHRPTGKVAVNIGSGNVHIGQKLLTLLC
jgi:hypothetical protein